MRPLLTLFIVLFFSYTFADLGELRRSFEGIMAKANVEFDKATQMKPNQLGKGEELSLEDCRVLQNKIRKDDVIDPFEVTFENGTTFNYMCGGPHGYLKNYIARETGLTNQGLRYSFVIQLEHIGFFGEETISDYYLDENYNVVEIQGRSYQLTAGELVSYEIRSKDRAGNIYFSSWTKRFSISETDIEGTHNIETYIAADGEFPYPLSRSRVTHDLSPQKDYMVISLGRSDKKDWD